MAHLNGKLTKRQIETLTDSGRYADGSGLYLYISRTGGKSWVLRTVVKGRRRDIGLGGLSYTPLQEARRKAMEFRAVARNGGDPMQEARREIPTFQDMAVKVHKERIPTWKNGKHTDQWINTLRDYAFPHIGEMQVSDIGQPEILKCLSPVWTEKHETAKRLAQRIKIVLDVAKSRGFRAGENPVTEIKESQVLPKVKAKAVHHKAMPWQDVPAFFTDLRERPAMAAKALMLTCLTGLRTGEVLGAQWNEFDFDTAIWTVPASRMKGGEEHRVPLVQAMQDIIEPLKAMQSVYVFEGQKRNKPLSNMAMLMLLRRMKVENVTVHGFRSTFRDWASEVANAPRELAEMSLSHKVGSAVEQAYARSDLLERRRGLMERWAGFVTGESGKVVRMTK